MWGLLAELNTTVIFSVNWEGGYLALNFFALDFVNKCEECVKIKLILKQLKVITVDWLWM